jgi:hypothetical protein
MIFGRREANCPRCAELNAGAAVVRWAITDRKAEEAARLVAIRTHDCVASHCGVVCTAFEW